MYARCENIYHSALYCLHSLLNVQLKTDDRSKQRSSGGLPGRRTAWQIKRPAKGRCPSTVDAATTRDTGNAPIQKGKGGKGKAKGKGKGKSGAPAGFQVQQRYDVASSATNTPDEWLSVSVYICHNACYTCGNRWCKGPWHGTWDNNDAAAVRMQSNVVGQYWARVRPGPHPETNCGGF